MGVLRLGRARWSDRANPPSISPANAPSPPASRLREDHTNNPTPGNDTPNKALLDGSPLDASGSEAVARGELGSCANVRLRVGVLGI